MLKRRAKPKLRKARRCYGSNSRPINNSDLWWWRTLVGKCSKQPHSSSIHYVSSRFHLVQTFDHLCASWVSLSLFLLTGTSPRFTDKLFSRFIINILLFCSRMWSQSMFSPTPTTHLEQLLPVFICLFCYAVVNPSRRYHHPFFWPFCYQHSWLRSICRHTILRAILG